MKKLFRFLLRRWCLKFVAKHFDNCKADESLESCIEAQTIYNYLTQGVPYKEDWF